MYSLCYKMFSLQNETGIVGKIFGLFLPDADFVYD